ncbi:DNA-directed RNA polymerase III subunit RPC3, putative [Entamoeba invadens IP1]|uniref:DNA-directed RNA polymerase III subunit RPC3 n=1 Tax=Entamoeba invadens IP1 TaxID=370355 RepID=A0A0A1UAF6_ENTIV|nr:DNA-directed RNA polymerase III subunit RPC3, putative [Entamoeba invadens IP1]ELP90166.1 DNA-directed RNA polymerase III subunit RPC3, putative [Entamoeba invadens IP1]|eukprot:XP_004256937.1 DNA-directed RNA polymerase III subunit RPC3, putative [Entamoeba invadens IP1]
MNTTIYDDLIIQIISNQFGEFVGRVSRELLLHPTTIFDLWRRTKFPYSRVYEALLVLLHHGILRYSKDEPMVCSIDQNRVLFSLRHPHFVALMQVKFGDLAKSISMTLLSYGMLNFDDLYAVIQSKEPELDRKEVKKTFDDLVKAKYIMRVNKNISDLAQLERTSTPAPSFSIMKQNDGQKKKGRKKSKAEIEKPIPKKMKAGVDIKNINSPLDQENQEDVEPVWMVNIEVYNKENILSKILEMATKKFDEKAGPIINKMWELSACGKTPVDFAVLCQNLIELPPETVRKYLEMMTRDEPFIVAKNQSAVVAETNSYKLQVEAATAFLKGQLIESTLSSRYGVLAANVFRVLKMKHVLTDSQIADLLIGDIDNIRGILFKLFQAGFINGQEVPRSHLRGGKNAYFMWSVNFSQTNAILLRETAKAIMNTTERYRMEISMKAELIAKFKEGEEMQKLLLNTEEMSEYMLLDKRQRLLLDALYNLSGMFFCLKDY